MCLQWAISSADLLLPSSALLGLGAVWAPKPHLLNLLRLTILLCYQVWDWPRLWPAMGKGGEGAVVSGVFRKHYEREREREERERGWGGITANAMRGPILEALAKPDGKHTFSGVRNHLVSIPVMFSWPFHAWPFNNSSLVLWMVSFLGWIFFWVCFVCVLLVL